MNNILLMPFLTDSTEFANGFECGIIWELLKNGETFEKKPIHKFNKEQIELICETLNCNYISTDVDDYWCFLSINKTEV
jgi:hypothetical protein